MDHARIAHRYINTWFVVRTYTSLRYACGALSYYVHLSLPWTKHVRVLSIRAIEILQNLQVDVVSSVPVEMMYSHEDMDKAGFMRLNKVIALWLWALFPRATEKIKIGFPAAKAVQACEDVYGYPFGKDSQSVQSLGGASIKSNAGFLRTAFICPKLFRIQLIIRHATVLLP